MGDHLLPVFLGDTPGDAGVNGFFNGGDFRLTIYFRAHIRAPHSCEYTGNNENRRYYVPHNTFLRLWCFLQNGQAGQFVNH